MKQRRTGGRAELDALWAALNGLILISHYATQQDGGVGDGTTAGRLRTTASVDFTVGGLYYTKASTDDLWNLSAETDTEADEYRAYWLYLNAAGTASFAAGANAASAAAALKALPAVTTTKSVIGVFVADPSCNFDDAGGLAAQGTIYDGVPAGVPNVPTLPEPIELVHA
jgi:hypothetical protein